MEVSDRYIQAIGKFDHLNAQDPNHRMVHGEAVPFELFFANCMSEWIFQLDPDASEVVRLAARCQHLCRWEIPRSDYPEGRVGYLTWRKELKSFHANKSAKVLKEAGYDAATMERVEAINLKKGLESNEEVQLVEDALCLVFLENQLDDLIEKTSDEKMVGIIQKTWKKMSEKARKMALKLPLSEKGTNLMNQALNP